MSILSEIAWKHPARPIFSVDHKVAGAIEKEPHTTLVFIASVITPVLFSLFVFFLNGRYFFVDDKISDFIPKAYDIGWIMREGGLPWLTTNIMNGGAYAIEFQYGVFNPVQLLLNYVLPSFSNYAVAAWFMVAVYLSMMGGAGFILGRNIGLRNGGALTLSLLISLNFYSLFWNASSWMVTFAGSCWLVLGLAFLAGILHQDRLRVNLVGLFFSFYFCVTAGRPESAIALAIAALFVLMHLFFVVKNYSKGFWVIAAGICAGLSAAPALFPLLSIPEFATRSASLYNEQNFLVAPLDGLIAFSDPLYYAYFTSWGGYKLQEAPSFYIAWFLLPLLCVIDWTGLNLKESGGWVWGVLALLFALAAMGPERLGLLRFPIRYVLYFQFCLTIFLMFGFRNSEIRVTRGRVSLFAVLLFVQYIHSMQSSPSRIGEITLAMVAVLLLSAVFIFRLRRNRDQGYYLYASSLSVVAVLFIMHPHGRGVDWGFPADAERTDSLRADHYTLFYGDYVDSSAEPNPHFETRVATTGMLAGDRTINGYSALGHKGLQRILGMDDHGNFQENTMIAESLFAMDEKTGLTHAELMRIDRIIAQIGPRSKDIRRQLPDRYMAVEEKAHTQVYDIEEGYTYPGLVSWVSSGTRIDAAPACEFQHVRECVTISSAPPQGGEVIFARLWFPGYRAYLGDRELPVSAHKSLWVSVPLPPSAQGSLRLEYTPPGLRTGLWLAGLGMVLFVLVLASCSASGRASGARQCVGEME